MKYFDNMTRGQLNCNPLNIRRGSNWKGLSPVQSDKSFCQFDNVLYGYRAALIVLRTYKYKYHLTTIKDVINRFAPVSDGNNVESYCNLVVSSMLVSLDSSSVYHEEVKRLRENFVVNRWINQKQPHLLVYHLLKAMAQVESSSTLDIPTYLKVLELL